MAPSRSTEPDGAVNVKGPPPMETPGGQGGAWLEWGCEVVLKGSRKKNSMSCVP